MDFEAQRKKRMEDLAIKRKRLEEMRKQRSEKNSTAETPTVTETISPSPQVESTPPPPPQASSNIDVDDLVNSLLSNDTEPSTVTSTTTTQDNTDLVTDASPPVALVLSRLEHTRQRSSEWTTCQNVCTFTISPVVPEVYEKGIQTESSTDPLEDENDPPRVPHSPEPYQRSPQRSRQRSRGDSAAEEGTETINKSASTDTIPVISYTPEEVNDIVVRPLYTIHSIFSSLLCCDEKRSRVLMC